MAYGIPDKQQQQRNALAEAAAVRLLHFAYMHYVSFGDVWERRWFSCPFAPVPLLVSISWFDVLSSSSRRCRPIENSSRFVSSHDTCKILLFLLFCRHHGRRRRRRCYCCFPSILWHFFLISYFIIITCLLLLFSFGFLFQPFFPGTFKTQLLSCTERNHAQRVEETNTHGESNRVMFFCFIFNAKYTMRTVYPDEMRHKSTFQHAKFASESVEPSPRQYPPIFWFWYSFMLDCVFFLSCIFHRHRRYRCCLRVTSMRWSEGTRNRPNNSKLKNAPLDVNEVCMFCSLNIFFISRKIGCMSALSNGAHLMCSRLKNRKGILISLSLPLHFFFAGLKFYRHHHLILLGAPKKDHSKEKLDTSQCESVTFGWSASKWCILLPAVSCFSYIALIRGAQSMCCCASWQWATQRIITKT